MKKVQLQPMGCKGKGKCGVEKKKWPNVTKPIVGNLVTNIKKKNEERRSMMETSRMNKLQSRMKLGWAMEGWRSYGG
jgi:hypothetical protein